LYRSPLSFSTLSLLFHISFIHPLSLPSSFSISPRSFLSLSLSFGYIHSTWAQFSLSLFIAHSAPSFLSFHPIPVFSLLIPTSKSRHHFSFFCTLSPRYSRISSVTHLSYFLLYLDSLILSLLPCLSGLCPFHIALHSSIFLLLLIFPLLHWHTRFSLSFFSVFFFFILSSIPLVSCTLPFRPFCPHSNIFLVLPLPLLVLSIPRSLPRTISL
jgi:hypothetical protein